MKEWRAKEMKSIRNLKELGRLFLLLVLVFGLTFCLVSFVGQRTVVVGASMEPTLSDGDNLIIDKLSYRFREPERFEVVIFPYGLEEDTYFIKRIIGMPGENISIEADGSILVNGERLIESYGREIIRDPGAAADSMQLGDDEYFVLGDNRNDSMDSRNLAVGLIPREEIIGRAWVRIYPLGQRDLFFISTSKKYREYLE